MAGANQPPRGVMIQQQQQVTMPVPPGPVLDGLEPHIPGVGKLWWATFQQDIAHRQSMEREALRVNESVNMKNLTNQELSLRLDASSLQRAQWITAGLMVVISVVFLSFVGAAVYLFLHDKVLPGTAFTALGAVLCWAFRSIVFGYLQKPEAKKK